MITENSGRQESRYPKSTQHTPSVRVAAVYSASTHTLRKPKLMGVCVTSNPDRKRNLNIQRVRVPTHYKT